MFAENVMSKFTFFSRKAVQEISSTAAVQHWELIPVLPPAWAWPGPYPERPAVPYKEGGATMRSVESLHVLPIVGQVQVDRATAKAARTGQPTLNSPSDGGSGQAGPKDGSPILWIKGEKPKFIHKD